MSNNNESTTTGSATATLTGEALEALKKSVASSCPQLKLRYETCFQRWYKDEFLKGSKKLPCDDHFREYQACVMDNLKKNNLVESVAQLQKEFRDRDTPVNK